MRTSTDDTEVVHVVLPVPRTAGPEIFEGAAGTSTLQLTAATGCAITAGEARIKPDAAIITAIKIKALREGCPAADDAISVVMEFLL